MDVLFGLKDICIKNKINVVLIYISEAHTDDKWPIGLKLKIGDAITNCNSYPDNDIQSRLERAKYFI